MAALPAGVGPCRAGAMSKGWELLARWPGGTVAAMTAVPGTGLTLAATAAGLHRSSDGGQTWEWVALGPDAVIEAVAASAGFAQDGLVLLGTTSGVHLSVDGGKLWRPVLAGSRVQALSATADFSADGGAVLAGTESDGILRSDNGGRGRGGGEARALGLELGAPAGGAPVQPDPAGVCGAPPGAY